MDSGEISVKLLNKKEKKEKEQKFLVNFSHSEEKPEKTASGTTSPIIVPPKVIQKTPTQSGSEENYPVIIIRSDGHYEKNYRWKDDDAIECFSHRCSINLNATDSYSPDKSQMQFLWKFGNFAQKNGKNPANVVFSSGIHTIDLTVTDAKNRESHRKIYVFVPEKTIKNSQSSSSRNPSSNSSKKSEKSENAPKKIPGKKEIPPKNSIQNSRVDKKNSKNSDEKSAKNFSYLQPEAFISPEIIVQNGINIEKIAENSYICRTKNDFCNVNFSLSKKQK